MKRAILRTLVGLVLLAGAATIALGQEGKGEGPDRPSVRRQRMKKARPRRRLRHRKNALRRLAKTEEGEAESERFKKELKSLGEERKKLHEAIREGIKGGTAPKEAFQAKADDIKALIKTGALARIEHHEKMLTIARKYVDKGVDRLFKEFQKHAKGRKARVHERRRKGEDDEGDDAERPRRRLRVRRDREDDEGGDAERPRRRLRVRRDREDSEGGDAERPRRQLRKHRPDDEKPDDGDEE